MLVLDAAARLLSDGAGQVFDPARRRWAPGAAPAAGRPVPETEAVRWLQRESGHPCRQPVAVIGPRDANPVQRETAHALGLRLGGLGLTVLCGGRTGVMEAVCRGVAEAGGISVGLLPDAEPEAANPYVTIPIATGIGVARNALIARAALCLVAVGGGYGTMSEMAFGLQFGKPVLALADAPEIKGAVALADVEAAALSVARAVLGLPVVPR